MNYKNKNKNKNRELMEEGLTQAARSFWERLISRGDPGAR